MLIIFLIYALIPLFIVLNILQTDSKKIKKCRLIYAIPAIILTIINIGGFMWHHFYQKITLFQDNSFFFLIPGLSILLVLIVYGSGKKQEKIIQTEIASEEIERVRNTSVSKKRHDVILSSDDMIEKL